MVWSHASSSAFRHAGFEKRFLWKVTVQTGMRRSTSNIREKEKTDVKLLKLEHT